MKLLTNKMEIIQESCWKLPKKLLEKFAEAFEQILIVKKMSEFYPKLSVFDKFFKTVQNDLDVRINKVPAI